MTQKNSFRVLITENCNANCKNCFNSNYRTTKEISIEDFENLSDWLSKNGITILKIMGGEPTVHTNFEKIILIAQKYFKTIVIFTNAINDKIKNINLRESDYITYNAKFINNSFDFSKFLLNKPGYRSLEIQIPSDVNVEQLKGQIKLLYDINILTNNKVMINFTLDCIENIFSKKDEIIKKWNNIVYYVTNVLNLNYDIDHNIPLCFSKKMNTIRDCKLCNTNCAGLIDANLNLLYCNQYPVVIDKIDFKNKFCDIIKKLNNQLQKKLEINMNKGCQNCKYFLKKCNGGCFLHKNINKKEDFVDFLKKDDII